MNIILPTLAVAFAAFCVWLAVRIINRRERWAKWTLATVVGVPLLYVASFGPACWISSRANFGDELVERTYWPLIQGIFYRDPSPFDWFYKSMHWYSRLAANKEWGWSTDDSDGHGNIFWVKLHRGPPPLAP
jgi:hypothetical protein